MQQRPINRLVRFNRQDVSPRGLENWEVSEQEVIERNESSDEAEDETCTEVNKEIHFSK